MLHPDQYTINDYLNKSFPCECGKAHSTAIKQVSIGENTLSNLPEIIKESGYKKAFILYDTNTHKIAGSLICGLLKQEGISYVDYVLKGTEPVPDEAAVGEILIHYDPVCDFIIGVGSGTINDLSRFISYKMGNPYMIVATAPSMDGFASNVAPLIVNNMKTTYEAHVPLAIIGDIRLLKKAPMKMIAAGIGDILGKFTCLCDWEISHIITGEYHCSSIEAIVRHSLDTVVNNLEGAGKRDPEAIKSIMEALVLSGIAMSFAGNSRPASGSEHHLSHYWEMIYLFLRKPAILHGIKVGIGTVAVIKAYELLMVHDIDFREAEADALNYSKEKWEAMIKSTYYKASEEVIALEGHVHKNDPVNIIPRIRLLEKNWDRLKKIAGGLPSADLIRSNLAFLGSPCDPMSIGLDKSAFIDSFLVAKDLRNRYGILQILFDLGLSKEIAEKIWEYFLSSGICTAV